MYILSQKIFFHILFRDKKSMNFISPGTECLRYQILQTLGLCGSGHKHSKSKKENFSMAQRLWDL